MRLERFASVEDVSRRGQAPLYKRVLDYSAAQLARAAASPEAQLREQLKQCASCRGSTPALPSAAQRCSVSASAAHLVRVLRTRGLPSHCVGRRVASKHVQRPRERFLGREAVEHALQEK